MATAVSRVLLATRSEGKLRELTAMLSAAGLEAVGLATVVPRATAAEDALEAFDTFEENATAKARYFFGLTGIATIADDSGIEVAALGGAPGVRSKRWSGRDDLSGQALDDANNALLLARLRGVADRRARYVCAAAYCDGRRAFVERGAVAGRILEAARGSGGFGYDPYFVADELGRTFGEVSASEKASVSHRARAVAKLLSRLGRG